MHTLHHVHISPRRHRKQSTHRAAQPHTKTQIARKHRTAQQLARTFTSHSVTQHSSSHLSQAAQHHRVSCCCPLSLQLLRDLRPFHYHLGTRDVDTPPNRLQRHANVCVWRMQVCHQHYLLLPQLLVLGVIGEGENGL